MRVIRELQERTGGITEFVPLSFIPFHTLLGRTHGIEEISREENLKHTAAFRLALGRSVPSLTPAGSRWAWTPPRRHSDGVSTPSAARSWRSPSAVWPAAATGSSSTPAT